MVTPVGLGVRVPDIAETLDRAEQWKANRLAQLVQQRAIQDRERFGGLVQQHGGALFGGDPAARRTALEALVRGGGVEALPLATNFLQMDMQRETPLSPQEVAALGLPRGAVVFRTGAGGYRVAHTPPQAGPESFGAPVPLQNPRTGQVELVQVGNRGTVRPVEGYGPPPQPADVRDESTLRDKFQALPIVRAYDEVTRAYEAIREAAPRDTAAADLNIVIGYAKMLDPTSIVQEGEQETVRRTGGPADFLVGWVNSLRGGGRLTPDMRANILREAQGRYAITRSQYDAAAEFYSGLAGRYGFNPQNVVMPRRPVGETRAPSAAERATGAPGNLPSPRTVQDYNALPSGTRFLAPDGTERVKP